MYLEDTQAVLSIKKHRPEDEKAEVIYEEGGDPEIHNLLTLELEVEGAEGYTSFHAYIQGYPEHRDKSLNKPGYVGVHKENLTTTEIYFPLCGDILVKRGDEDAKVLQGVFPDLRYLKNSAFFNIDPGTHHAILTVEDIYGITYTFTGFVIPGGVDHMTIQGKRDQFTRFLAIKIDQEELEIATIKADGSEQPIMINF
jgi:hypothetical protein